MSPALGTPQASAWQRLAVAAVTALLMLEILWELWLAPVRPGGSWLALKALPLALMWPPLARGTAKARQGMALLLLPYIAEGVVRGISESGRHALVAWTAALVATVAFIALLVPFRNAKRAGRHR